MDQKKVGKATLIKEYFELSARDAVEAYKKLTDQDRLEIASAIARQKGLTEDQCDFQFVDY
jgi:hypothetical protein